jgi:hypothetical protein
MEVFMRLEDELKLLKEKVELLEKIKELQEMIDKHHTALSGKGGDTMEYHWFMIMVSWDIGADSEAVQRFAKVYLYLNVRAPYMDDHKDEQAAAVKTYNEAYKDDPIVGDDPIHEIVSGTLKPFNLIGRRRFVILLQTSSNRVLQRLSKMISLYAPIRVEIFPATYVTELKDILLR